MVASPGFSRTAWRYASIAAGMSPSTCASRPMRGVDDASARPAAPVECGGIFTSRLRDLTVGFEPLRALEMLEWRLGRRVSRSEVAVRQCRRPLRCTCPPPGARSRQPSVHRRRSVSGDAESGSTSATANGEATGRESPTVNPAIGLLENSECAGPLVSIAKTARAARNRPSPGPSAQVSTPDERHRPRLRFVHLLRASTPATGGGLTRRSGASPPRRTP